MNKKLLTGIIVIIVVILAALAIQSKTNNETTDSTKDVIKVGVILPLSGDAGNVSLGETAKKAIEMSLEDLDEKNIQLFFEDGAAETKTALSAYNKLQDVDKVDIIVALDNQTLEVVKPIINKTDELMFTIGNESSVENDNVFEIVPWASVLFKYLAEEADTRYEKIAIVYAPESQLFDANKKFFFQGIGDLDYIEVPVTANSDVRTEVTKMLNQDVDAYTVFLETEQATKFINEVVKQSGSNRPDVICDGNVELRIDQMLEGVSADVLEGCISTMLVDTTSRDFVSKYQAKYSSNPGFLDQYGYDAIQIISKILAKEKKSDWKKVLDKDGLEYTGVSGKIVFDETGSRIAETEVHIFKNGKFVTEEK